MISERKNDSVMVVDVKNNLPEFKVGDRIECLGDFGTIKYIGPVVGHPSIWLGIDWDSPDRGKHNGTVGDTKYFVATFPKSGSFVRPEKVQFGQSALSSIISRYGKRDDEYTAKWNEQQLRRLQQSMNAPFLEMVGFDKILDKQSDFYSLQVINVRMQNINSSSPPMELRKLCPNVKELDISKNLLSSWSIIFDICSQLEFIEWLNVSENLMIIPDDYQSYRFPNIKTLVCGYMRLTWEDILKLSTVFPELEELRAPYNSITDLGIPADKFTSLEILDLEGNKIENWQKICKLSVLPLLNNLILENIGLTEIAFEGDSEKVDHLDNVRKLSIIGNQIDNWESISELNRMRNLESLRFLRNPILETANLETRYQMVIARIANLKVLNSAEIKADERRGAEYDYLKKYCLEWFKVKHIDEERRKFLQCHNRYLELLDKYGTPEESELVVQSKAIKSSLVSLQLVHNNRVIVKKLPKTILVQKLALLFQKLFDLSDRPCLVYVSDERPDIEIELDDDGKEIGYYSLQDGDQIIVKI